MLTTLSLLSLSILPNFVLSVPLESLAATSVIGMVAPPIEIPKLAPDLAPDLAPLKFENKCTQRSAADRLLILQELLIAKAIVQRGTTVRPDSLFYQAMYSRDLTDTPGFDLKVHQKYTNLLSIYTDNDKKVKITCDESICAEHIYATTFAAQNNINICPAWFDNARKAVSNTVASDCRPESSKADNWKNLAKFKRTKSFTLVHEMTHLRYATGSLTRPPRAGDYAYDVPNCKTLAEGNFFNTKCNPNPNGPPVQCPAEYSFQNADSLAFVPAGEYWQARCGRTITVDNEDGSADPVDFDDEDIDNP